AGELEHAAFETEGAARAGRPCGIAGHGQGEVHAGTETCGQQHQRVRSPRRSPVPQLCVRDAQREGERRPAEGPAQRATLDVDASVPPARQQPCAGARQRLVPGDAGTRAGQTCAGPEIDVGVHQRPAPGLEPASPHPPPSAQAAQRSPARAGHAAPAAAGATGPAAGSAGVTRTLVPLDEYDVVVISAVEGLDLQADRTTDLRLELPEGGGLLVQEAIHDVLVSEYQQLTTGKLSALSHNFPKNLVAHRFRSADETAPRAAWTRLTQQMFQALAGALAGHFHEPERREAHDVRLGAITGQRPLEGAQHGAPVRLIAHVDEVDDDDAAE